MYEYYQLSKHQLKEAFLLQRHQMVERHKKVRNDSAALCVPFFLYMHAYTPISSCMHLFWVCVHAHIVHFGCFSCPADCSYYCQLALDFGHTPVAAGARPALAPCCPQQGYDGAAPRCCLQATSARAQEASKASAGCISENREEEGRQPV